MSIDLESSPRLVLSRGCVSLALPAKELTERWAAIRREIYLARVVVVVV